MLPSAFAVRFVSPVFRAVILPFSSIVATLDFWDFHVTGEPLDVLAFIVAQVPFSIVRLDADKVI